MISSAEVHMTLMLDTKVVGYDVVKDKIMEKADNLTIFIAELGN